MPDRKIFIDDGPAWLRRAIQIRLHEATRADSMGQHLTFTQELEGAQVHSPRPDGSCAGCLPTGTRPWPCRKARHLFRQHRGEVGWRPHWDQHIEAL